MPPFSLIPPDTLHKGCIYTYSAASRRGPNPTIAVAECFKFTPSSQQDDGTRISALPSWHRVSAEAAAKSIAAGWYLQIHDNHPADHVISNTLADCITDSPHATLSCPTVCFKPEPRNAPSRDQDDVSCLMLQRNAVPGESLMQTEALGSCCLQITPRLAWRRSAVASKKTVYSSEALGH